MAIRRMRIVRLQVTNWTKALDFYTRTLGLKLRFESPNNWAELDTGDGSPTLALQPYRPDSGNTLEVPRGGGATVVFSVDSVEREIVALLRRGVNFVTGTMGHDAHGIREIPGYGRLASFNDPDGNSLQLLEPESH